MPHPRLNVDRPLFAVWTLLLVLATAAPAQPAFDTLSLGDTVLYSTEQFTPGAYRTVIASYPHAEGKALVYTDRGEFLSEGLRRQEALVHLRHVGPSGDVRPGPTLRRSLRDLGQDPFTEQGFVGGPDYTLWWTREVVPGADNFARVQVVAHDGLGEVLARHVPARWERSQTDHLRTLAAASRYGMAAAVAVLTTRRRDRLGAQREAGAVLSVEVYGPDGGVAHRSRAKLPDLRADYELERLIVDDGGTATVILKAQRWRTRVVTWGDPLVPDYVSVRVDAATDAFTEQPLLPTGKQLRALLTLDQEPNPPTIIAAYSTDLAQPIEGLSITVTEAATARHYTLAPEAIGTLPEGAVSGRLGRDLSGEFQLEEVRYGPDGRLYALFVDVYAPQSIEVAAQFQRIRERDGLSDGVVLFDLDPATPDGPQTARFRRVRQRSASGRRGVTLVPDGRGNYGLLYNEEPRNLGPQKRRRGRFTALDFAVPTLALPVEGGDFAVAPLPYRTPFPQFPSYVYPGDLIVTPGGIGVGFSPLEEGFGAAMQYGYFPMEGPAPEVP